MPSNQDLITIIIEPNSKLPSPYCHLPKNYNVVRFKTIKLALWELVELKPHLVFLSASFSSSTLVRFLEAFKGFTPSQLIPVIMIVDLSHRLNFIPGTSWGGKMAVLDSQASKKELYSALDRVL